MKTSKQQRKFAIQSAFIALVAVFLGLYIKSVDYQKLTSVPFHWQYFVIASVIGLLFLLTIAQVWRVVLRALGAQRLPGYWTTTPVYARAWMGRYIPGTVTWIAGKVYLASNWGVSKRRLSVGSLLEAGSQILATTAIAFLLLGFDQRSNVVPLSAKIGLISLGVAVLIILTPVIFNKLLQNALKLLKKGNFSEELAINGQAVLRAVLLNGIGALLYGLASFFVVKTIVPTLSFHDLAFISGSVGLATVAGMAAPFAPSGIGIKDGLLLVLLGALLPAETALAATILLRIWSVIIDLVFLGLNLSIEKVRASAA